MELLLTRVQKDNVATVGKLYVDGVYECFTLEDMDRVDPVPSTPENEGKVWGQTAIPEGRYPVIIDFSPHFQRQLPRLLGVPGFEGVLIHSGNTAADTNGCILVGQRHDKKDEIEVSRVAFDKLFAKLLAAKARNEHINITIKSV